VLIAKCNWLHDTVTGGPVKKRACRHQAERRQAPGIDFGDAMKNKPRAMSGAHRSECPINLTLELLGDAWTLLVLRDIVFGGKRHFRELLQCQEGIASNILADRLKRLVNEEMLTRTNDPSHKQKAIYSLTEKSIALVPAIAQIAAWGSRWLPASKEMRIRAQLLEEGGPPLWDRFMAELRAEHLGRATRTASTSELPSVRAFLNAAYDRALSRRSRVEAV
jgi:DNA-binding HxlR family transcriptional regulator